jgi:hypothetical protein
MALTPHAGGLGTLFAAVLIMRTKIVISGYGLVAACHCGFTKGCSRNFISSGK